MTEQEEKDLEKLQPKPPAPCKYCGIPIQWIYDSEAGKRKPMEGLNWHKCKGKKTLDKT